MSEDAKLKQDTQPQTKRVNRDRPPEEIQEIFRSDNLLVQTTQHWNDFLFPRAIQILSPKGPLSTIIGSRNDQFPLFFQALFEFVNSKQIRKPTYRFEFFWKTESAEDGTETKGLEVNCFLVLSVDPYQSLVQNKAPAAPKTEQPDQILHVDRKEEKTIAEGDKWAIKTKKFKAFLDCYLKDNAYPSFTECPVSDIQDMFEGFIKLATDRNMPELNVTCNHNDIPSFMRVYVPDQWAEELYSPYQKREEEEKREEMRDREERKKRRENRQVEVKQMVSDADGDWEVSVFQPVSHTRKGRSHTQPVENKEEQPPQEPTTQSKKGKKKGSQQQVHMSGAAKKAQARQAQLKNDEHKRAATMYDLLMDEMDD
ncbi:hypothetical protein BLNAU_8185 [Blattamonas nauphoetae]|uniref:Uncharacterized protein n=1 Tax=Blattamonas nauphoetae TaxID=2049346 RepID=A0ABQ9XZK2_9EUKA|nr:hypothetical protein BLNAU_8185 [Blattamonas nauphoetae]